jgi:hypothetical protein
MISILKGISGALRIALSLLAIYGILRHVIPDMGARESAVMLSIYFFALPVCAYYLIHGLQRLRKSSFRVKALVIYAMMLEIAGLVALPMDMINNAADPIDFVIDLVCALLLVLFFWDDLDNLRNKPAPKKELYDEDVLDSGSNF